MPPRRAREHTKTMRIVTRFFANTRDIVGSHEVRLRVADGTTLSGLLELLFAKHPRLRPFEEAMLVAVNEEFAEPATVLRDGDEVAIMPPVSGGCA